MWPLGEVKSTHCGSHCTSTGQRWPRASSGLPHRLGHLPESTRHECPGPPLSPRPDQKPVEIRASTCHFSGSNSTFLGLPEGVPELRGHEDVNKGPMKCGVTQIEWGGVSGTQEGKGQHFSNESELACVGPEAI